MTKEVKKAYKIIEEYEKKLAKEKEENDFSMYEKAGCHKCSKGQIYSGGGSACSVKYYKRCDCSRKHTKRYQKFLDDKDKLMETMTAKDYYELESKWYDNNSHITEGSNQVDRSW